MSSRDHGETSFRIARTPSTVATKNMYVCATRRNRRLSTRSPIVPARTAKRKIGTLAALCTKATYAAEPVRVSISHCAPTVCIQLPTLLTKAAAAIAANIR